jgi:polar amino acid transport system permease protein
VSEALPVDRDEPHVLSETELWRRRYRQRQSNRSTTIASVSTVLFAAVVYLAITHTPGWSAFRAAFLDGEVFRKTFPSIARAFLVDLKLMVIAEIFALAIGLLIATIRTSTGAVFTPLRLFGTVYVDLFRGCPMIILLYLFGLGIPSLQLSWAPKSGTFWGAVAITVAYSAYLAEVFRAGIQSVHPSQRAAARSLGLSHRQALRIVVLPQAVRAVLPALLNDFVALQKDVGLIAIVGGTTDAVQQANIYNSLTFNFTPYIGAALLFIALAIPSARIADAFAARANSRQRAGAVV